MVGDEVKHVENVVLCVWFFFTGNVGNNYVDGLFERRLVEWMKELKWTVAARKWCDRKHSSALKKKAQMKDKEPAT